MRVVVAGAGAMGSVYGALLVEGGNSVFLVDSWTDHIRAINEEGLQVEHPEGLRITHPEASLAPAEGLTANLVLMFSKSYATGETAERVRPVVDEGTYVLTLQNGLGNAEALADCFGPDRVLIGVSYHAARILAPGRVLHSATGETVIGPWSGTRMAGAEEVVAMFNASGIPAATSSSVLSHVWGKLLVNVGVNAVAAVTHLTCEELLAHSGAWGVVEVLVAEASAVATAEGVTLPYPDAVERTRAAMLNAGSSKASMLQDIERSRPTEIDALNGAIDRLAAAHGLDAVANRLVSGLVKATEAGILGHPQPHH